MKLVWPFFLFLLFAVTGFAQEETSLEPTETPPSEVAQPVEPDISKELAPGLEGSPQIGVKDPQDPNLVESQNPQAILPGELNPQKGFFDSIIEELEVKQEHKATPPTAEQIREHKEKMAKKPKKPGEPEDDSMSATFTNSMENLHSWLSDDVVSVAGDIDSFFVNQRIVEGRNRSNIRLSNTSTILEDTGYQNDFDFKVRLRLPQLQKRIQLEFEDDFPDDVTVNSNRALQQRYGGNLANNGSRGGFAFYETIRGIDTKLTSGLEWNKKAVLFGKIRFSKDFILTKKQKITAIHDFFTDTEDNKGQFAIINYDYSFNRFVMLRFLNEESYRDQNNTFQTAHGLSLFHQVSNRNFLSYNYRVNSLNGPGSDAFYLNNHIVNVAFRRRVYRQHFFYEVGPAMFFPKEKQFEGLAAFSVKLEVILGNI